MKSYLSAFTLTLLGTALPWVAWAAGGSAGSSGGSAAGRSGEGHFNTRNSLSRILSGSLHVAPEKGIGATTRTDNSDKPGRVHDARLGSLLKKPMTGIPAHPLGHVAFKPRQDQPKTPHLEHPGDLLAGRKDSDSPTSFAHRAVIEQQAKLADQALAHQTVLEQHGGPDLRTTLGHQTTHTLPASVGGFIPASTGWREAPGHRSPGLTVLGGPAVQRTKYPSFLNGTAMTHDP